MNQNRVKLNVGGRIFETKVDTLSRFPESLLGVMFSSRNTTLLKPDDDGAFFFDRNPEIFSSILEYYRTGHLQLSEKLSLAILHTELDYWQLKDAMAETEKQIIAKEAEESAKSLGRDLSQLALEEKRKTIDSHFYGLLHNQLRQGIKHAAKRGRHRVTFRFASKGSTYFGTDTLGNELYMIVNFGIQEILGDPANCQLLVMDLTAKGIKVGPKPLPYKDSVDGKFRLGIILFGTTDHET